MHMQRLWNAKCAANSHTCSTIFSSKHRYANHCTSNREQKTKNVTVNILLNFERRRHGRLSNRSVRLLTIATETCSIFFSYVYLLSSIFALNFPNHVLQWAYGDFFFSYSQVRSLCYLKGNVVSDGSVNLHHTIRSMCCFSICKIARGHRTLKWLKNLSGYCSQAEFLWKSVAVLLLSLLIKLTVLSLRLSWLIHLYDGNLWPMMHNALQPHSMSIGRTTWTTTIVFTPNQWKMFHWQNPIQMSNELCVELILIQKKKKNFFPVLPMSLIWRLQIRTQC